jgi:hypothetical protein
MSIKFASWRILWRGDDVMVPKDEHMNMMGGLLVSLIPRLPLFQLLCKTV